MPKRTIEVEIFVRCRDGASKPIGKAGHVTILFDDIDGCWGLKGRRLVADMIATEARDIVEKQAPTETD